MLRTADRIVDREDNQRRAVPDGACALFLELAGGHHDDRPSKSTLADSARFACELHFHGQG
jgi:hypothetical protein